MSDLIQAGRSNVLHTYLDLAKNLPGTTIEHMPSFMLVNSRTPLTIGNMALAFNFADVDEARDAMLLLKLQMSSSPVFRVFSMTGDAPADLDFELTEYGFREESRLQQMTVASVDFDADYTLDIAQTESERRKVSDFMVSQFSFRRTSSIRRLVSQANTASRHILYYRGDMRRLEAAMMLSECDQAIGLYNLCVAPHLRKQGLGRGLLSFAHAIAKAKGKYLVFQADADMKAWYTRQGAQTFGLLKAFSMPSH